MVRSLGKSSAHLYGGMHVSSSLCLGQVRHVGVCVRGVLLLLRQALKTRVAMGLLVAHLFAEIVA